MKIGTKIMVTMIFAFLIAVPLISSQESLGVFKQNQCVELVQTCSDCTYVTFTRVNYPDGTLALSSASATQSGSVFNYTFCNTSQLGIYVVFGIGDAGGEDTVFAYDFEVTPSGRDVSDSKIFANVLLFIFFILIALTFFYVNKKIDYQKWHNSIVRKYENRNFARVIISSIGFNLLKNAFIWYYLLCFPIILLITDIAYTFGVESMIYLMQIFLMIYYFGFIVVGIFFFGYLQEWIMALVDEIKSLDWGLNDSE